MARIALEFCFSYAASRGSAVEVIWGGKAR
jgi:hypothetical protein